MPTPAFLSVAFDPRLKMDPEGLLCLLSTPSYLGETLQTDPQNGHISKSQTECNETAGLSTSDSVAVPSLLVATLGGEPRRPLPLARVQ